MMSVYVQQKKERERENHALSRIELGRKCRDIFLEMLGVIARGDEFVGGGADVGTRATKVTCCVELY